MQDCIFCKIVAGEIAANKRFEDSSVVVFDDIHPDAPTHVLIVPRKHIVDLVDLRDLESLPLIVEKLGLQEGYRLIVNAGKYQEVKHLHYHLKGGMK